MNNGHRWTALQDEDALACDWSRFYAIHGDAISYDAYRVRRGALRRSQESEPVQIPSAEGFVGLSIGYLDIETTYSTQPRVLYAATADAWGNIDRYALDDPKYAGESWIDDSVLVEAYARSLERFAVLVSWNGKMFDLPVLNGRLNYWRAHLQRAGQLGSRNLAPIEPRAHIDAMYYATSAFNRIGRRSLESVSTFFGSPHRKTALSPTLWDRADHGDQEAYDLIKVHCDADVLVLRDVFDYLQPQIRNIHR